MVTITILQGICGMAFGLLVSALCDNEQDAIQLALGSFYPNLLLSGIIWPLEGMPMYLRFENCKDYSLELIEPAQIYKLCVAPNICM